MYSGIHDNLKDNCCLMPNIIAENGYYVCTNCGVVHSKIIENQSRLAFTTEERNNRQTTERVYSPYGPRTLIIGSKDANGNKLNPNHRAKFERLSKINRGLINGYERNLWFVVPLFNRLKSTLNIPDYIAEDAYRIYILTAKKKLAIGRSIEAILAASIYCAFKMNDKAIFINEILENINSTKKEFLNCFRLIIREILPMINIKIKAYTPLKYIDKLKQELNLSMKCRSLAVDIIQKAHNNGLSFAGKDPKGIAAASLYISAQKCEEARIQKDICNVANITEVTLRARIYELNDYTII